MIFQRLGVVDLELVSAVDHRQVEACVQVAGSMELVAQYRQRGLESELPVILRHFIFLILVILEFFDSDSIAIIRDLLGSHVPDQQSDQHHDHYLISFVAASLFHSHSLFLDLTYS